MPEAVIDVADVRTFETKGGNTRYVVEDERGGEYTTFREQIGQPALELKGSRARIAFHEQQRGRYTNVYLDAIEPATGEAQGAEEDTDPEEVGWRTAVEAAPYLTGTSEPKREVEPGDLFEKLKPFKDKVAEDIREDGEEGEDPR
jgi:hypothetical protein